MSFENPNGMKPPLDVDLFEIDSYESRFVIRIRPETITPDGNFSFREIEKKDVIIKKDDVFIIDFESFVQTAFALCYQDSYKRLGHKLKEIGEQLIKENNEIVAETVVLQ